MSETPHDNPELLAILGRPDVQAYMFEHERAVDERWLGEFQRYQAEQDEKLAQLRENFKAFEDFTYTLMSKLDKPLPNAFSGDAEKMPDALAEAMEDAYRLMHMGSHFDFLLKEIKRQEGLHNHWEDFMMMLRLAEDDESAQYHRF